MSHHSSPATITPQELIIQPIFSGGVGRSGTTLIGRILRKHSDVFGGSPNEIKFITEAFGLIDVVCGVRSFMPTQISKSGYITSKLPINKSIKVRYSMYRKRVLGSWWSRTNRLGYDSGLHRAMSKQKMQDLLDRLESELDFPINAARNFIQGFVTNHRKWQGQKYWIDTTPANMMYADGIYRIFPEAKFIEMRRDPLDNLASVLKEPWGPNHLDEAIPWYRDRIILATNAKNAIPAEQHLTLQLEDLVLHNRSESYRRLIEVSGLRDQSEMQRYFNEEITAERAHIGRGSKEIPNADKYRQRLNSLLNL